METVTSRKEVYTNLFTLYGYLNSENDDEQAFSKSLLKNGGVFYALKVSDRYLFGPSRYVGYSNNSMTKHIGFLTKDGRETNHALLAFMQPEQESSELLKAFKDFIRQFGIERNYETGKTIRFFYDEENIKGQTACYFISPTHIEGKKREAWSSFVNNGIAALGWNHTNYTNWTIEQVTENLKASKYNNESEAINAYKLLFSMKEGDIVCGTNVNHGLLGIGIVASRYKHQLKIHNTGADSDDEWYSDYVDVAWIVKETIKKADIVKPSDEGWWVPYGTISVKESVPKYIEQLLLKKTEPIVAGNTDQTKHTNINSVSSLNTILYGPPGTGKTYFTVDKALQIVAPDVYEQYKGNRDELTKQFRSRLIKDWTKDQGEIAFITFHQSMNYEDFIEGIKPVKPDNATTLHYEIVDGIFKKLCALATRKKSFTVKVDEASSVKGLTKELFEELYYAYSTTLPSHKNPSSPVKLHTRENYEFELFQNGMESIVVKAGTKKAAMSLAFSELSAILFNGKEPTYKAYAQIVINEILRDKEFKSLDEDSSKKNFILIIDEINRGNVSQIFGELITLIEDSKRQGEVEEASVTLPYSKTSFSVPSNVYIIGTMNTADRSVEALDTALRRRFVFEEKRPQPSELSLTEDGISIPDLLTAINDRLEMLIDRDHTIGHAWMMGCNNVQDLKMVFANKILPLLQEFFYNDYSKIGLVLGETFVKVVSTATKRSFATFSSVKTPERNEITAKSIFRLQMPEDKDLATAFKSIYILPDTPANQ